MTEKKTALVVCPGRGAYNKTELGYFARLHGDKADLLATVDRARERDEQPLVNALDSAETFTIAEYSRGDNASPLIFACSYADYLSIDQDRIDVVGITGNSMGWYTALACAGALTLEGAVEVVNGMGALTHSHLIGAQALFSVVAEDWRPAPKRRQKLMALVDGNQGELYVSIEFGGVVVLAGSKAAIEMALENGPAGPSPFPMRLPNHGAFHSPMMADVSDKAKSAFSPDGFQAPQHPLIDGRGKIWQPRVADPQPMWDYTFGAQVLETYRFTTAIQTSVREFAPDYIILLGPGDTLGGAVAQSLIEINWRGLSSKADFASMQIEAPYIISMGRGEQRALVAADTAMA